MRTGPRLFLMLLLIACGATSSGDDSPVTCAFFPIEYDDVSGEVLFLVDEYYPVQGVVNCSEPWGSLAWYSSTFSAWPEYCPDCTAPIASYYSLNQDRGLKSAISPCASLCSLVPERIPTATGGCVCPRQGITSVTTHDIQIVPSGGGTMISVRLFEATFNPACMGSRKASPRTIRIGFETERTPLATCRPFTAQPVSGRSHVIRVDYHGQSFPILTKTRMTATSLAATLTSSPVKAD